MDVRREVMPGVGAQTVYPISEKDAALMHIPYFLPFEPDAVIPTRATGIVDHVVAWNDFVCTKIGFTSETVGFPATAGLWKVQIQDVRASRSFQPEAFNITALIGANSGVSDSPAADMPTPWPFLEKTTIRVTFESIDNFGGIPHLLLIGYLTNWARDVTAAQARQERVLAVQDAAAEQPWGR